MDLFTFTTMPDALKVAIWDRFLDGASKKDIIEEFAHIVARSGVVKTLLMKPPGETLRDPRFCKGFTCRAFHVKGRVDPATEEPIRYVVMRYPEMIGRDAGLLMSRRFDRWLSEQGFERNPRRYGTGRERVFGRIDDALFAEAVEAGIPALSFDIHGQLEELAPAPDESGRFPR